MNKIYKLLESEWETRLRYDVECVKEQKPMCERHKMTMYHEENGRYDNKYIKMTVCLLHDNKSGLFIEYVCYYDRANIPPHNNAESHWLFYHNRVCLLRYFLHNELRAIFEIQIQDMLLECQKTYVANVLLKTCIITLLELYANTHFHNLRNIERILADDYLVKMILQY